MEHLTRARRQNVPLPHHQPRRLTCTSMIATLLTTVAFMTACGPAGTLPPEAATGTLEVTVLGLPDAVPARLTLTGAGGVPLQLTTTMVVTDVPAGAYTLLAEEVCSVADEPCPGVDRYLPETSVLDIELAVGEHLAVQVVYGCALIEPPDANLAAALRAAVRIQVDGAATSLSCFNVGALREFKPFFADIADLEGLQHAQRLEELSLVSNAAVADLTPLAALHALRRLNLGSTSAYGRSLIDDLTPISELPKLERLIVSYSLVDAVPDLTRLPALRELAFLVSDIDDLSPLAGLQGLELLNVSHCQAVIEDTPPRTDLSDLTPLAGLTTLTSLTLGCHAIGDVGALAGLTQLRHLALPHNDVASLGLVNLTALETLDVRDNALTSLSQVAYWPNLSELDVSGNTDITNLRPLFIHGSRHATLRRVSLERTCAFAQGVPTAGYVAFLEAQGVVVELPSNGVCIDAPPPAVTTFEVDTEGWTTSGDAVDLRRIEGGGPFGHPYLEADDRQAGVTWYWEAPPHYLGNASSYIGGRLVSYLRQSDVTNQFAAPDVILEGAGLELTYRHGVAIGTEWTRVIVPLSVDAGGWMRGDESATEADLESVLWDLTRLRLRGEYRVGADTGGLGYVWFGQVAE